MVTTPHLDSHSTTDPKPEILSAVLTGKRILRDGRNICGIIHVHVCRKDDIFRQRRQPSMEDDNEDELKNKEDLHIAGMHTALDIFRFAVFFLMDLDLSLSYFLFTINLKKNFGQKIVVQTK